MVCGQSLQELDKPRFNLRKDREGLNWICGSGMSDIRFLRPFRGTASNTGVSIQRKLPPPPTGFTTLPGYKAVKVLSGSFVFSPVKEKG